MTDLKTNYLGMELSSPIIAASCSLTNSLEGLIKIEKAGAGAVVLKSLFEEQIIEERIKTAATGFYSSFHTEAVEYIAQMSMNFGPEAYLKLIMDAKKSLKIPVIASINCISKEYWIEFAKKIETAGADAIELNISHVTHDIGKSADSITDEFIATFKAVKQTVKIPVCVKLGQNFTNVARMVKLLETNGAAGVVLFNRFYQVDIDTDKLLFVPGYVRSSHKDITETLRWIGIISGKTKISIAGSRGVRDGKDVVKILLSGGDAVQVASTLYKNGVDYIADMNREIATWMEGKGFDSISKFKGLMSHKNIENPEAWERQQYIKAIVGIE